MADPQTENGFVMIALDLFSAIMTADLSNRCMIVLSYHLVHSYGPAKKRDVFLDPASIEECTHLHRNNVRRAIKELCEANVFEKRPGAVYRFNKDYEGWTPGGVPFAKRLNGGAMEFAAWAVNAHGKRIKKSKPVPIQPDSPPIPLDSVTTVEPNPVGLQTECLTESDGIAKDADPTNMAIFATSEITSDCGDSLAYTGVRPHKSIRFEIGDSKDHHQEDGADDDELSFPVQESLPSTGDDHLSVEAVPDPEPIPVPSPAPALAPSPPVRTAAALRAALTARATAPSTVSLPDPATVRELEDFALVTLGDRGELENFHMHIRGWLFSYQAGQIRDAVTSVAARAREIKAGKLAAYTVKVLQEGPTKKPGARAGTESSPEYTPRTKDDDDYLDLVYSAGGNRSAGRAS